MKIIGIDQSLSKTAYVLFEEETPLESGVIRTGLEGVKKRIEGVPYFASKDEQIEYIADTLFKVCEEFQPNYIIVEALAFGATGNVAKDLAGVYYVLRNALYQYTENWADIFAVAPTTLKSFARGFLPIEEQTVPKPNGKKGTNLLKMEKADVIRAMPKEHKFLLDGLRMSGKNSGMDDVADAYFLCRHLYNLKRR